MSSNNGENSSSTPTTSDRTVSSSNAITTSGGADIGRRPSTISFIDFPTGAIPKDNIHPPPSNVSALARALSDVNKPTNANGVNGSGNNDADARIIGIKRDDHSPHAQLAENAMHHSHTHYQQLQKHQQQQHEQHQQHIQQQRQKHQQHQLPTHGFHHNHNHYQEQQEQQKQKQQQQQQRQQQEQEEEEQRQQKVHDERHQQIQARASSGTATGTINETEATGGDISGTEDDSKVHILLAVTGSVATIKIALIIGKLKQIYKSQAEIQLIVTASAEHFMTGLKIPPDVKIWHDDDEWDSRRGVAETMLHVRLRRWADILLVAPLSANTLAKIANGICNNLITSVMRSWNPAVPILVAPAMNTHMYTNPMTKKHLQMIKDEFNWVETLRPVEKVLVCGDIGMGGMREWSDIVDILVKRLGGPPGEDEEEEEEDEDEDRDSERGVDDEDGDDEEEAEEEGNLSK